MQEKVLYKLLNPTQIKNKMHYYCVNQISLKIAKVTYVYKNVNYYH